MNASEFVCEAWTAFSAHHVGEVLPMNYMEQDEHLFMVGHACDDDAPPITMPSGQVVRRVIMSFDLEDRMWTRN